MSGVSFSNRAVAALLAVVVVLGACSAGDGDRTGSPAGDTPSTETPDPTPWADGGFGSGTLVVTGSSGETSSWPVLVAADRESRRRGLMGVTDLGGWVGMVFVFETDVTNGFWMKDTLIPLTVVYLDSDGGVVSAVDMEPCPPGTACPVYSASGSYRMALEVPLGDLGRLGIEGDSTLSLVVSRG